MLGSSRETRGFYAPCAAGCPSTRHRSPAVRFHLGTALLQLQAGELPRAAVQGAASGGLGQSKAGTQSGALTTWSVWMGHVSLGAAGDSALPRLLGHVITATSLCWLHTVPPTQNREEVGTVSVAYLFPSREAAVLGRRGSPCHFLG